MKYIVITGCDTGFGRLSAPQLAKLKDCHVIAGCLQQKSINELNDMKLERLTAVLMDVTSQGDRQKLADLVQSTCPEGLYCLINNAGIGAGGAVFDTPGSAEQDAKVWNVNFVGAVETTRILMPHLRKFALNQINNPKRESPRVISVTSVLGRMYLPSLLAYVSSKHALEAATNCLRLEFAPFGIFFTCIEPWWTKTPIVMSIAETEGMDPNDPWFSPEAKELREIYGQGYAENQLELFKNDIKSGKLAGGIRILEPQEVIDVFVEACLAKSPKRQYLIAPPAGKVLVRLQQSLPEFLDNTMVHGVFTDKRQPYALSSFEKPLVNTWDPNGRLKTIAMFLGTIVAFGLGYFIKS